MICLRAFFRLLARSISCSLDRYVLPSGPASSPPPSWLGTDPAGTTWTWQRNKCSCCHFLTIWTTWFHPCACRRYHPINQQEVLVQRPPRCDELNVLYLIYYAQLEDSISRIRFCKKKIILRVNIFTLILKFLRKMTLFTCSYLVIFTTCTRIHTE